MIAFFTTIGFGASLSLLKIGGPQVLRFFLLATVFAVVQNVVGILIAIGFGLHPLFGVLAGSVTLTGGPATGLAFAPLFEQAGVVGASSVAIAVAIGGIVCGGLVGGPVGHDPHRARHAFGRRAASAAEPSTSPSSRPRSRRRVTPRPTTTTPGRSSRTSSRSWSPCGSASGSARDSRRSA